jgi:hypothetical protein
MHKKNLWLRLKSYHFDHIVAPGLWEHITASFGHTNPSAKAFARKIAKKHGWKNNFAYRATVEYKKFVYLGVQSNFQVTPSKVIDVVWHEHLLFSKAYRDFCNDVIEKQFDHHPELLPEEDQTSRYSEQYLKTIELYKTEFGLEPPPDIWDNTKFDKDQLRKKLSSDTMMYAGEDSTPLHAYFDNAAAADYPEFSGFEGGDAGGGGAGGDWGDGSGGDGGNDGGGDGGGCSGGCGGGD